MTGRDARGRFATGYSADRGRGPPPVVELAPGTLAVEFRSSVLAVANAPVLLRDGSGRRRTTSLFEAVVRRVATGQTSRRTSVMSFLRLVIEYASIPDVSRPVAEPAPLTLQQRKLQVLQELFSTGRDREAGTVLAALLQQSSPDAAT